jgi:phytoene dehydrogenase-like protein
VLERLDHVGGAAVSAQAFGGHPTRLSRYSYLVSLLPDRIVGDLGLDISLVSRDTASYTPVVHDGKPGGLHIERREGELTRQSFRDLTGSDEEYEAWRAFYTEVARLGWVVALTLLGPLPQERAIRAQVDPVTWQDVVASPLGEAIEPAGGGTGWRRSPRRCRRGGRRRNGSQGDQFALDSRPDRGLQTTGRHQVDGRLQERLELGFDPGDC